MKKAALIFSIITAFVYLGIAKTKDMPKIQNSGCKTHLVTSSTPEYISWRHMKDRCLNKNHVHYNCYGGRGITICESWISSFKNFLGDMGPMPVGKTTLDRIESNGNYEPSNCRWASRLEQGDNRRTSIRITINGDTKCISAWCRQLGITKQEVYYWNKFKGIPIEYIFTSLLQA